MQTLLVDENLPATLAFPAPWSVIHVRSLGDRLSDSAIWEYATKRDLIILTKDTDFYNSLLFHGSPPKVIWIRLGNCKRKDLELRIQATWNSVMHLLETCDLVEIHREQVEGIAFTQE